MTRIPASPPQGYVPAYVGPQSLANTRIATEFDTARHAGTIADPFTGTAIQSAINNLIGIWGNVNLPAVFFNVTSKITSYCGIGIEGSMPGWSSLVAPVLSAPTLNDTILEIIIHASYPTINLFPYLSKFGIVGGLANANNLGVSVPAGNGIVADMFLDHVLVYNCGSHGFSFLNGGKFYVSDCYSEFNTGSGFRIQGVNTADLCDSYILGNDYGIWMDGTATNANLSVHGCHIRQTAKHGIYDYPGHSAAGPVSIQDNEFYQIGSAISYACFYTWANTKFSFRNNFMVDDRGSPKTTYGVQFIDATAKGIVDSNTFGVGITNLVATDGAAATSSADVRFTRNMGYNPFGVIAAGFQGTQNVISPLAVAGAATPTSATTYTCKHVPMDIYWTGGTVSAQAKNGTAIPQSATSTNFIHLEPSDTYSITFTLTPTTFDVFGL